MNARQSILLSSLGLAALSLFACDLTLNERQRPEPVYVQEQPVYVAPRPVIVEEAPPLIEVRPGGEHGH